MSEGARGHGGQLTARAVQPALHDLVTTLAAPLTTLSGPDGQLRPLGAQGLFGADLRLLSQAVLTVDGAEPEPVSHLMIGAGSAEFVGLLRQLGDPIADPTVWVRRRRVTSPGGLSERVRLENVTASALTLDVRFRFATDLAGIELVKTGRSTELAVARIDGETLCWESDQVIVALTASGAEVAVDGSAGWTVEVPARSTVELGWLLRVRDIGAVVAPAVPGRLLALAVSAVDRRLAPLLRQSIADLNALRMSTVADPDDEFLAAGSPWYLTLFGRDSLWAARMVLPLGTELAGGTLRTLAARQGRVHDVVTAEQPGKILHEIRRAEQSFGGTTLPPTYFGSVDSTLLWVCLLADAWHWGLPEAEVAALIPAAEFALEWMAESGDSDGDGFLEYADASGRGLTNQGWKDSSDSIRFADGRIADGPVALAEVQGYAFEAARSGADLLAAFGRPGAGRWRDYADRLAHRFRSAFWVEDARGRYPALALDGRKRPVDAPASNMGHLLGTGLLSPDESSAVADRLLDPTMASGFGLRTMAVGTGGYSPLSYHCGSIWPHDTAIAVHGLLRAGFGLQAARLAEGLLAAGAAFGGRLPELFGGFAADDLPVPVPYPASCRPQAWSAAASVVLLQAVLGLEADLPAGTVTVRPSPALGPLSVSGLRAGGHSFSAGVGADGSAIRPEPWSGVTVRER